MLLAELGERGGAGERRTEVASGARRCRAPGTAGRAGDLWPRRPSGRRRRLAAVGLREAGYGGGGSGSCE